VAGENEATEEGLDIEPRPPSVIDWQSKLPKDGDYISRAYPYWIAERRGTTLSYSLNVENHWNPEATGRENAGSFARPLNLEMRTGSLRLL
jgi:hypothetical protein